MELAANSQTVSPQETIRASSSRSSWNTKAMPITKRVLRLQNTISMIQIRTGITKWKIITTLCLIRTWMEIRKQMAMWSSWKFSPGTRLLRNRELKGPISQILCSKQSYTRVKLATRDFSSSTTESTKIEEDGQELGRISTSKDRAKKSLGLASMTGKQTKPKQGTTTLSITMLPSTLAHSPGFCPSHT